MAFLYSSPVNVVPCQLNSVAQSLQVRDPVPDFVTHCLLIDINKETVKYIVKERSNSIKGSVSEPEFGFQVTCFYCPISFGFVFW
jgi:hypothetical protein